MKSNFITPFDFGAVGDGQHDDSPALQKALLEAAKTGKDLFIPAGKYLLSTANYGNKSDGGKTAAALHIFSNTRVFGEAETIIIADKGIAHILINDNGDNDNDNFGATAYNGGENITVEHITFDGGAHRGNGKCTPVNFSHAKNIRLNNMTVKNTAGKWHCIEINSSKNVEISNCNLGDGCHCSELIQLDAANNEGNLGVNDMTAVKNIRIFNNYFFCKECRAIGSHTNIKPYNGIQNWAENISFYNNVVEGFPCKLTQNITAHTRPGYVNFVYHTRNIDIYNNTFAINRPPSDDKTAPFYAVYVDDACGYDAEKNEDKTIHIRNNTFRGFDGIAKDYSFFTIHNNTEI